MNLTGAQRLQLTIEWIKRGKQGDRELFIKRVCEVKDITYIPAPKLDRKTTKKLKSNTLKDMEEQEDERY